MISQHNWTILASDIKNSHTSVPAQIARSISAPLENRSSWTADTWSYFLLFLGPIVLQDRLPNPYYRHFLKLSHAARGLTKIILDRGVVGQLHRELGDWVTEFEKSVFNVLRPDCNCI